MADNRVSRASNGRAKAARRDKIIAAAKQHFALRGFEGASTREIAKKADVAQSLLLYHFANKEELWKAVMDDRFASAGQLGQNVIGSENVSAREQLESFIRAFVDYCSKDADLHRLMTLAARAKDDRLKWLTKTHLRPYFEGIRSLIVKGQEEGWVRAGDPTLLYYSILAIAGTTYSNAPEIELLDPHTKALDKDQIEAVIGSLLFVD